MPPKNQNTTGPVAEPNVPSTSSTVAPADTAAAPGGTGNQSLSLEPIQGDAGTASTSPPPTATTATTAEKPNKNLLLRLISRADIILAILLILGASGLFWSLQRSEEQPANSSEAIAEQYGTISLPLQDITVSDQEGIDFASQNVSINGQLQANGPITANDTLTVNPTSQPANPNTGQLYFDQTSNVLAYYNGDEFINLTAGVSSVQGNTGDISFTGANGITITDDGEGNITFTGPDIPDVPDIPSAVVSSMNGLTGAISLNNSSAAGSTITVNDASTTEKGLAQFNPTNFTVTSGNVNTAQNINTTATPAFSGVNTNNITPSGPLTVGAVTQSTLLQGSNTTISSNSGDIELNSAGDIRLAGFNCTTFANGGLLTTDASGNILCADDDGGGAVPSFQTVYGNSTPASFELNGTNGGLIINDSAGGIGGSLFAVQNNGGGTSYLDVTASGISVAGSGSFTGSVTAGSFSGDGSALTNLNADNIASGTLNDARLSTNVALLNAPANFTGALQQGGNDVCTTAGNCAGLGQVVDSLNSLTGDLTLEGTAGEINVADNGSDTLTLSLDSAVTLQGNTFNGPNQLVQLDGSSQLPAVSGAQLTDLNATNITTGTLANARLVNGGALTVTAGTNLDGGGSVAPGGSITVDVSDNPTFAGDVAVQGGDLTVGQTSTQTGSLSLANAGSTFLGTLNAASLGQDTTFTLPDPGQATADICLTTGNCAGAGGGITGSGTTDTVAKFTGSGTIGDSSITDDGSTVTTTGDVVVQGGTATLGQASTANGSLVFQNSTNSDTVTIQSGITSTGYSLTLPTAVGSTNQCLKDSDGAGTLFWDDCDGGAGGSSVDSFSTINAPGGTDPVADSSADTLNLANGTNVDIQGDSSTDTITINVVDNPTFSGNLTVQGNTTLEGNTTIGNAATDLITLNGTIQGSSPLIFEGATANTSETTLAITDPTADNTITLPDASGEVSLLGQTIENSELANNSITFAGDSGSSATALGGTRTIAGGTGISTSESAGTLTINGTDATTTSKGIASFNDSYFGVTSGDVTIDDIYLLNNGDTGAGAYTFTGTLDLTGTVLQGANSLVLEGATANGFETTLAVTDPTADNTITFPDETGTVCTTGSVCSGYQVSGSYALTDLSNISGTNLGDALNVTGANLNITTTTSGNIVLNSAGTIELQDNTNITGNLDASGTLTSGTSNAFQVDASGEVTSGTINGQTISSSANFTGTVNVASTATVQGASITVGAAGTTNGSIVLQNSTNSFTTTIDAPNLTTGNATISMPDTAGSNDTFCLATLGNCSGAGTGGIAGSGTTNRLSVFTDSGTIGDSWFLQNTSTLELDATRNLSLLGGNLDVTGNGTFSGDLAVDGGNITSTSALSITNASGNITIDSALGTIELQNATNIASDLNVDGSLDASGTLTSGTGDAFQVDISGNITTAGSATIQGGTATLGTTTQQANLVLHDGNGQTTTLQAGDSAGNLSFVLPTNTGTQYECLKKDSGDQLIWDGCEGGSGGLSVSLQDAYTNGNTITTTDARDITFNLADTTTDSNFTVNLQGTDNVFQVQDSGTGVFTVADSGLTTIQTSTGNDSTTAFQVLDADGGDPVLNVDTENERVGIGTDAPSSALNIIQGGQGSQYGLVISEIESGGGIELYIDTGNERYLDLSGDTANIINNTSSINIEADDTLTLKTLQETFQGNIDFEVGSHTVANIEGVSGAVYFQNHENSNQAFRILSDGGVDTLFTADTEDNHIKIGNSTGSDAATTQLVLDSADSDPTTNLVAGAMYYNTTDDEFKCYFGGGTGWANCGGTSGGDNFKQGGNSFGATGVLGTNDTFGMDFITDGNTVASLSETGEASFQNSSDSEDAFNILNATGDNLVNVNSQDKQVTFGHNSTTVRDFDGTDDDIVTDIGALSGMTYGTVAAIVKQPAASGDRTILGLHDSGDTSQLSVFVNDTDGDFGWYNGTGATTTSTNSISAGDWMLIVARKDTGTSSPRFSIYNFATDTWQHENAGTLADSTSPGVGGTTRFSDGGTSNFLEGEIAARAAWSNSLGPSDTWTANASGDNAIENAGLESALGNWAGTSPDALWAFNQEDTSTDVLDLTGNGADQTSITGTTVVTGDAPSGFNFGYENVDVNVNGAFTSQNSVDSNQAFQVLNASGDNFITADTLDNGLTVGTNADFDTMTQLSTPALGSGDHGRDASWSPNGNLLAIAHLTSPNVSIFERDGDTFSQLPDPASLPAGDGQGVEFSPDGNYLAVSHDSSPYLTVYKRDGTSFTKLSDPASLPGGNGTGITWSPDGTYLAMGQASFPYIAVYKRSGDTFTKLDNPYTLPTGDARKLSFSPDGQYLSVAHWTSPYITIYKRNGDTFTKLDNSNIDTLPTGDGWGTDWSPDGTYMSVAHESSPYITTYKRDGDTFTKLADPTGSPGSNGQSVAWSPDGNYMSVGSTNDPWLSVFERDGDTFTELSDPSPTPAGDGRGVEFSPDSQYLSVPHGSFPYHAIYKASSGGPRVDTDLFGNLTIAGTTNITQGNLVVNQDIVAGGTISSTVLQAESSVGIGGGTISYNATDDRFELDRALGGITVEGTATFQNDTDSSTAFEVVNSNGMSLANIDTSNNVVTLGAASGVAGSDFLVDTFTDTDGTVLASHSPDTGSSWEAMDYGLLGSSLGTADLEINSNTLTTDVNAGDGTAVAPLHRNSTDPGADEYDIDVTMSFRTPTQAQREHAVSWRMTPTGTADSAVDRYTLLGDNTDEEWELFKTVGGSRTSLDLFDATGQMSGTTRDVHVEVRTDGMKVYADDELILESTDTEITQRGRVGIGANRAVNDNQFMDDLTATAVTREGANVNVRGAFNTFNTDGDALAEISNSGALTFFNRGGGNALAINAFESNTVTDDFNRADANPIGGNWTTITNCNDLEVVSNEVTGSSTGDNCAYWNADAFSDDQYAEVEFAGGDDDGGPIVRAASGAETFYTTWNDGGGNRYIVKVVSGSDSTIGAPVASTGIFQTGDTMRLEVVGDTLTLYRNGTSLGSRTDSSIASGSPGIYEWGNNSTQFDNFQAGNVTVGGSGQTAFTIDSSGHVTSQATSNSSSAFSILNSTGSSLLTANTVDGQVEFGGHVLPTTDDTYDLGSSSNRWRELFVGPSSLHVGTDGDEGVISYNTTTDEFEFDKSLSVTGGTTVNGGGVPASGFGDNWTDLGDPGSLTDPYASALDPDNNKFYVVDFTDDFVARMDSGGGGTTFGANYTTFGTTGTGTGQFSEPSGIAVDSDNNKVYVADSDNTRIASFDSGDGGTTFGANWDNYGIAGSGSNDFSYPFGIAVNPDTDTLYVSDPGNNRVSRFDAGSGGTTFGANRQNFGSFGTSSNQFDAPLGVAVDDQANKMYVMDFDNDSSGNERVARFDSGGGGTTFGQNWEAFGTPGSGTGQFDSAESLAIDIANNELYVADEGNSRIAKFDSGGGGTTLGANWDTFGTFGSGTGEFDQPDTLALNAGTNTVYVLDYNNSRYVSFDGGISATTGSAFTVLNGLDTALLDIDTTTGDITIGDGNGTISLNGNITSSSGLNFIADNTTFQNTSDSTTAFQVLDADGGSPVLNVDTVNEWVGVGTATPDAKLDIVHSDTNQSALKLHALSGQVADLFVANDGDGDRTTYLNEKGELRVIAANDNTVAARIKQRAGTQTGNLTEWTDISNNILSYFDAEGGLSIGSGGALPNDVGLRVAGDDGAIPTIANRTNFLIHNTSDIFDNASMSLISGTSGDSSIYFGDADDEDIGQIEYRHEFNIMRFIANDNTQMLIDQNGNLAPRAGAGTQSLGRSSDEWGELFVGDDNGINFGLDQDAGLAYESTNDRVELTGSSAGLFIEDTLSLGTQTLTITDDGTANDTLTATASYVRATVDATGNGGTPDLAISETGAVDGDILIITSSASSADDFTITDSAGVVNVPGASATLGPEDSISLIYMNDRWITTSYSDN